MKLSIVIICWNDWKVIEGCLNSIFAAKSKIEYEVIVSDNGSCDGSTERIHEHFPHVRIVENRANLGFAKGNNAGIREAGGEYILILNPDTVVHDGSLDRWIAFADRHPEAGAFGCRVQNVDGTYQESARPFPTISRDLVAALYLRPLALLGRAFTSDTYYAWGGDTEREIDWQSGCCVMFRGQLLKELGGFDERFFYHFEEVDLCKRVWSAGHRILFTPAATITHLGGQSVSRFPVRFALETSRSRYRYFQKHFGNRGVRQARRILLLHLRSRRLKYALWNLFAPSEVLNGRLQTFRVAIRWNESIDPIRFVEQGVEPRIDETTSLQTT